MSVKILNENNTELCFLCPDIAGTTVVAATYVMMEVAICLYMNKYHTKKRTPRSDLSTGLYHDAF